MSRRPSAADAHAFLEIVEADRNGFVLLADGRARHLDTMTDDEVEALERAVRERIWNELAPELALNDEEDAS